MCLQSSWLGSVCSPLVACFLVGGVSLVDQEFVVFLPRVGVWGRHWGPAGAEATAGRQTPQPVCIGTTTLWSFSLGTGWVVLLHTLPPELAGLGGATTRSKQASGQTHAGAPTEESKCFACWQLLAQSSHGQILSRDWTGLFLSGNLVWLGGCPCFL